MSKIIVKQLFIHPIKGLSPQIKESVYLKAGHGIPGDRAFALMFNENPTEAIDCNQVPWMKKQNFAMQNDWHSLAALDCFYDETSSTLTVRRKEVVLLIANTSSSYGRECISNFFTGYLAASYPSQTAKHSHRAPLQLVGEYNTTRYPDREIVHISLVSQSTIDSLSEIAGKQLDARRFRPNIVIDGIPAWGEFEWVGKQIQIGNARIEITAPINRCLNIDVNPETGERDIALLPILQKHCQHTQTGVVAKIVTGGAVAIGEEISK